MIIHCILTETAKPASIKMMFHEHLELDPLRWLIYQENIAMQYIAQILPLNLNLSFEFFIGIVHFKINGEEQVWHLFMGWQTCIYLSSNRKDVILESDRI